MLRAFSVNVTATTIETAQALKASEFLVDYFDVLPAEGNGGNVFLVLYDDADENPVGFKVGASGLFSPGGYSEQGIADSQLLIDLSKVGVYTDNSGDDLLVRHFQRN